MMIPMPFNISRVFPCKLLLIDYHALDPLWPSSPIGSVVFHTRFLSEQSLLPIYINRSLFRYLGIFRILINDVCEINISPLVTYLIVTNSLDNIKLGASCTNRSLDLRSMPSSFLITLGSYSFSYLIPLVPLPVCCVLLTLSRLLCFPFFVFLD